MLKYLIAGALGCSAWAAVAQTNEELPDTVALGEIEVKAVARITHADREVILPPASAVRASVNGRDLIGRLRIPRVNVNPLTGEIGMTGNGKVAITINGVMSSAAELAAIAPEDITKVERIDNPGPRYPDADLVLNVVTRRHVSGGYVAADLMNAFKKGGEADMDNLALGYSRGKSQWSYSGQLMRLRRDNWARDYSETRVYPTHTVEITEIGKPAVMETAEIVNCLAYSIADEGRYLFNAKLGFVYADTPHSEEADRVTTRSATDGEAPTEIYEHMGERSWSPSVDLYGQARLPNGANLIANVVGTYIGSENNHVYRQTALDGTAVESLASDIRGRKYSLIGEGAYSQRFAIHSVSGGIRHFQSYARNEYRVDAASTVVSIRQAQTTIYGRYNVTLDRVELSGSLGATRFYNSQDGQSRSSWIFTPSLAASWTDGRGVSLRYKASLRGRMPSLAELSDVAQMIDPGYARRGNPGLKAYRILDHELSAGWEWRWLGVNLAVPMCHEYNPVIESVIWDGGYFTRTYFNQKSFTHIGAELAVTVRPWKDHITLSVTPAIDYYRARGRDFDLARTIRDLRVDAEFNWKCWQLSYNTFTGYANYMYGTRLMRERDMSMITAGYKSDKYTVKVGVLDPFVKRYWMETSEMAPLLSSVSRAYSDRPTYFVAQVSVNLNFGRGSGRRDIELENSDTDSGLLKGVK